MKKFIIIGSESSSIILFRSKLIENISDLNFDVVAVSNPISSNLKSTFSNLGLRHRVIKFRRRSFNPLWDILSLFSLIKLFREEKPDIVLAYTIKPIIWGGIASLFIKTNFFALVTGLGYAFNGESLFRNLIKKLVIFLYKFAMLNSQKVIFQNRDNLDVFIKNKIVNNAKTALVNGSGVDIEFYKKTNIPNEVRFIQVSRLLGEKGVREYCHAAEIVKKKYPNTIFYLLGEEDYSLDGVPISEIKRWQNKNVINYIKPVDDVRPYLSDCSVCVLASYHEGIPRSVLEAMSMGRAILTTDAPGCRETVESGKNGFLVRVGDVNDLVEKMTWFINNQDSIATMGNESYKIAMQKYDVKIINNTMLEIMNIK